MVGAFRYSELRSVSGDSAETQKILDFFISVAGDEDQRRRNDERRQLVDKLFSLQMAFRNFVPFTLGDPGMPVVYERRTVPFFQLFAESHSEYREVFDRLRDSEAAAVSSEKFIYYDQALKAFMVLEAGNGVEAHELVRLIVYLDCPSNAGDELAYKHVKEMLVHFKRYRTEFRLAMSLVAPRVCRFDDGEWYANESLKDPDHPGHKDDPRLHFARARNSIEWITTIPDHPERQDKWERALTELQECIRLSPPESRYEFLRPLGYNNLAYVYCLRSPSGEVDEGDLKLARENLDQLKKALPKESWPDGNVNFFHTEALIEWCEAASMRRAGELEKAWLKLNSGAREIAVAVTQRPNPHYKKLQDLIANEIEAISKQTAETGQSLGPITV